MAISFVSEQLSTSELTRDNNYDGIRHHDQHKCVLPKSRSFTADPGTKAAVLPKGRPSVANAGTMVAVLLVMNKCGSFPLLSAVMVISVFSHESLNLSCIFDNGYLYIYTELQLR